jgi:hypothetical protein
MMQLALAELLSEITEGLIFVVCVESLLIRTHIFYIREPSYGIGIIAIVVSQILTLRRKFT